MKKGFSIILSVGNYGGFYWHKGYTKRVCIGWVSITFIPDDIDNIL
jgi:hypothetical protein